MSDKNSPATESDTTSLKLVSRLKYPVRLKLTDGETVFVPAHGTIENIASTLVDIENLPVGIHKVEFQA